jgi:hypothetical protein
MKYLILILTILIGGCSTLDLTPNERRSMIEDEIIRERAGDNLIQMSQSLENSLISNCKGQ